MHLFLVSENLQFFAHVHPLPRADGSFEVSIGCPTVECIACSPIIIPQGQYHSCPLRRCMSWAIPNLPTWRLHSVRQDRRTSLRPCASIPSSRLQGFRPKCSLPSSLPPDSSPILAPGRICWQQVKISSTCAPASRIRRRWSNPTVQPGLSAPGRLSSLDAVPTRGGSEHSSVYGSGEGALGFRGNSAAGGRPPPWCRAAV